MTRGPTCRAIFWTGGHWTPQAARRQAWPGAIVLHSPASLKDASIKTLSVCFIRLHNVARFIVSPRPASRQTCCRRCRSALQDYDTNRNRSASLHLLRGMPCFGFTAMQCNFTWIFCIRLYGCSQREYIGQHRLLLKDSDLHHRRERMLRKLFQSGFQPERLRICPFITSYNIWCCRWHSVRPQWWLLFHQRHERIFPIRCQSTCR